MRKCHLCHFSWIMISMFTKASWPLCDFLRPRLILPSIYMSFPVWFKTLGIQSNAYMRSISPDLTVPPRSINLICLTFAAVIPSAPQVRADQFKTSCAEIWKVTRHFVRKKKKGSMLKHKSSNLLPKKGPISISDIYFLILYILVYFCNISIFLLFFPLP